MLTKTDLAKYPFTVEATEYIKSLRIGIMELSSIGYEHVLERAEQRIKESEKDNLVSSKWQDTEVEIISFPTAIMLISHLNNENVARRYALSESKRAYGFLRDEIPEKILEIAGNTFGWKTSQINVKANNIHELNHRIHFTDYLRNSRNIKELKWKITNRLLHNGVIFLTNDEVARLLEEEIQRKVYFKTRISAKTLPDNIKNRIKTLENAVNAGRNVINQTMPKTVIPAAMPPCIKALNHSLTSRKHLSHIGRFTLTSFLLNIGVKTEDIIKMFSDASDFSERLTRYQVEHIAGSRGVKTKYIPPKCDALKTHSLCINPDELCKSVKHPLSYYRKRAIRRRFTKNED